jgi:hypothetical protein
MHLLKIKCHVLDVWITSSCLNQVLSTGLGRIVPNLISKKHTNTAATGELILKFILITLIILFTICMYDQKIRKMCTMVFLHLLYFAMPYFAAVLYAFFGIRLLYIAWKSSSAVSQQKEFEEVCRS